MWRFMSKLICSWMLYCVWGSAISAPVTYSFSTSVSPFGTFPIAGLFDSNAVVSGTFKYDAEAPVIQDIGTGLSYGGYTPGPGKVASFSDLVGVVSGINFSDTRGVAIVGNDRPVDSLALSADPSLTSTSQHNFNGFSIGGYSLVNVRLFWLENQMVPGLISDFLNTEAMPAVLPTFDGRLAFDFIQTGTNPTSPAGFVFFDGLTVTLESSVPEPETIPLLLAGLGCLALCSRHRGLFRARQ